MEGVVHLDTHVIVWLYSGDIDQLSAVAKETIEANSLIISPMVHLELTYLQEIGRLTVPATDIIEALRLQIGLNYSAQPFEAVTHTATTLSWTRDPFDRLITADALTAQCPLVTKDEHIHRHLPSALW
jgi:PIN domain nuclease of toxin-antitoxin system